MKLSVVIPVYNEVRTLEELLYRVQQVAVEKEIIVIDDGSTDGTRDILEKIQFNELYRISGTDKELKTGNIKVIFHENNQGKGASLNTGFQQTTGDVTVVQDGDLEYDPQDYLELLKPIATDNADVVYGSRFQSGKPHRVLFFRHYMANKFLTFLSNLLTNLNLTDMETCYKMVRTDILRQINIQENQFGIEPELTAKLAGISGIRIYEIGISYYGRTYEEGKKIGTLDGLWAIYCIFKYNILRKFR